MARTRLHFIRRVLYRLKRRYGLPILLCKRILGETDLQTGEKDIDYEITKIKRAVVQPARFHRDFVYDLAFISANKDFTTGGFFDAADRRIIIEARDIPSDWDLEIGHFVIFDNSSYEVKGYYELEHNTGYALTVRETEGQDIVRLEEVTQVLTLQQTSVAEVV